jgi:pyrimidine operon attenuation protein / uracil phosphoribosyltransferase
VKTILDKQGMADKLSDLADQITGNVPDEGRLAVIGIRSRGEVLAGRLIELLKARGFDEVAHGVLDITLYRDDLAEIGPRAVVRSTEIDFDLNGCTLILVDDVLWTGRSVRAALNALTDLGRPRAIRLAVLVDRPGRELPIQADFVGVRTDDAGQHVNVMVVEADGEDKVEVG